MKQWNSGRVQDKLINQLERKERREAFERDRFIKFKLSEIHSRLTQRLLMERIIETDSPASVSDLILAGLKKAMKTSEFDFKYFIAPIRGLVPRPNAYALYMTQYIMEVVLADPHVAEVYGTDVDIYKVVNEVISQVNMRFQRTEEEILGELSKNKTLTPGSRQYDIALEQLVRKKMGAPEA